MKFIIFLICIMWISLNRKYIPSRIGRASWLGLPRKSVAGVDCYQYELTGREREMKSCDWWIWKSWKPLSFLDLMNLAAVDWRRRSQNPTISSQETLSRLHCADCCKEIWPLCQWRHNAKMGLLQHLLPAVLAVCQRCPTCAIESGPEEEQLNFLFNCWCF